MGYGTTQCYLPHDTSEHTPQTDRYWIYLPGGMEG